MPSEAEAVEALMELGLSEYEARCFAALTQLSNATAKEISQVADVPQSRVYDVTEQLYEMGLVDIQQSDPKKYFALPVEKAMERLRQEYDAHLETADEQLQALEGRETEDGGVWAIANRQDVTNRIIMHVGHATDELYLLVAHEDLLHEEILDALAGAQDGDVTILVEVSTESARERLHDAVPAAGIAVTDFSANDFQVLDQAPGRLLMVDRETVLMSAQQEGLVPDDIEETGVWGSAIGHGLVVWVQQLLETRRKHLSFDTATE